MKEQDEARGRRESQARARKADKRRDFRESPAEARKASKKQSFRAHEAEPRKACKTFSFSCSKEGNDTFSLKHTVKYFGLREGKQRFEKSVKYVPLGYQKSLWGRFSPPKQRRIWIFCYGGRIKTSVFP